MSRSSLLSGGACLESRVLLSGEAIPESKVLGTEWLLLCAPGSQQQSRHLS